MQTRSHHTGCLVLQKLRVAAAAGLLFRRAMHVIFRLFGKAKLVEEGQELRKIQMTIKAPQMISNEAAIHHYLHTEQTHLLSPFGPFHTKNREPKLLQPRFSSCGSRLVVADSRYSAALKRTLPTNSMSKSLGSSTSLIAQQAFTKVSWDIRPKLGISNSMPSTTSSSDRTGIPYSGANPPWTDQIMYIPAS